MSSFLRRLAGVFLSIFSAASLVVTIFLVVNTWQIRGRIQDRLVSGINHAQETLTIASSSLVATQHVLTDTQNILQGMVEMMLSVSAGVHEVPPILKDLEELSGKNMPQTIAATQLSLAAAQDSAGRIEDMLTLVSQIPFFPGGKYEPEVTLKEALGQVSEDLDGFVEPLENMQDGIKSTRTNLESLEIQGIEVALDLRKVSVDLENAGKNLTDSQAQIENFDQQLQIIEEKIPGWLAAATWVLIFMLAWIGLAQVGWLMFAIRSI